MNEIYSSTNATNAIADRAIRDARRNRFDAIDSLRDILAPVGHVMVNRGKLTRAELRPMFDRLIARLRLVESIIDLRIELISSSRMSANDAFRVRFLHKTGAGNILKFIALELTLTRRNLRVYANSTGFYIHAHTLARYMQREQKSHTELLTKIVRPIYASIMLAKASGGIALATDDGILLGTTTVAEREPDGKRHFPITIIFDRNGVQENFTDEERTLTEVMILTFIDKRSMNESKDRVFRRLLDWEQTHAAGIRYWFEANVFDQVILRGNETAESVDRLIGNAKDACHDLVASNDWRYLTG